LLEAKDLNRHSFELSSEVIDYIYVHFILNIFFLFSAGCNPQEIEQAIDGVVIIPRVSSYGLNAEVVLGCADGQILDGVQGNHINFEGFHIAKLSNNSFLIK